MSIDKSVSKLSEILKEATENESSVCYVTGEDAEFFKIAIDAICKYQKVEELWSNFNNGEHDYASFLRALRDIMQDRNPEDAESEE